MSDNPYQSPQIPGEPSPELLAASAKRRDRIMLILTAFGIYGSIMAIVVVLALFRVLD